ncbi:hypothetical protein GEI7407_0911 [Geitlerinema sp. PCC 7407]|nr:hypothetical protein GEI7407_0911 [Geitlerinema sp. PCC 7407]
MNREPEAFQQSFLSWLLQDSLPLQPPSGEHSSPDEFSGAHDRATNLPPEAFPSVHPVAADNDADSNAFHSPHAEALDPLEAEVSSFGPLELSSLEGDSLSVGNQPLKSREMSTVQDRFHALIKRRLQTDIQRHPPLFPWETQILDYEPESDDILSDVRIPQEVPAALWLKQLQTALPVPVPEIVLGQILERCQAIMHSALQEGAKLVQAVEALFPGQAPTLNHLAGLVLVSPLRSGTATLSETAREHFPRSYETADPAQQMVLSLLAAREILSSLRIAVGADQAQAERQWLTALGPVTLRVQYLLQDGLPWLRVEGALPGSGSLQLQGAMAESFSQCGGPGNLCVELAYPQVGEEYALEVELSDAEEALPLRMMIGVTGSAGAR